MTNPEVFSQLAWGKWRLVWLESSRIESCIAFARQYKLDGLALSKYQGFTLDNIGFLGEHNLDFLKGIVISTGAGLDITGIERLTNLRFFSIVDNRQPIDFGDFPHLEDLRIEWHPKVKIGANCTSLKSLYLRRYKSKSKDLRDLAVLSGLESLEVVISPIHSLDGVGDLKRLKHLELAYLSRLEDIEDVLRLSENLDTLMFDHCKRIVHPEAVTAMTKLRILALNDCGEIPSIHFLHDMPNLRDFRFVNTNVVDGDMTPCFRLEYAGFLRKRHYSHSPEEVEAEIARRLTETNA